MKDLQKWLQNECHLYYTIEELNNLTDLDISGYGLTELHPDINELKKLKKLKCHSNNLITIKLNNKNLRVLFCHNNLLLELILSCPKLTVLYCAENRLSELKLTGMNLELLYCQCNPLVMLELDCPSLDKFKCDKFHDIINNSKIHRLLKKLKAEYTLLEESKMSDIL